MAASCRASYHFAAALTIGSGAMIDRTGAHVPLEIDGLRTAWQKLGR